MEPNIETGSMCFINTRYKYEDVKIGDVISYKLNDNMLVTHRVVEISDNGIETKGDANESNDVVRVKKYSIEILRCSQ